MAEGEMAFDGLWDLESEFFELACGFEAVPVRGTFHFAQHHIDQEVDNEFAVVGLLADDFGDGFGSGFGLGVAHMF